jgi:hypothetical protein
MPWYRLHPVLLFVLGAASALFYIPLFGHSAAGRGFEPIVIARAIAEGKGFSNPYGPLETGPTAHSPPVYPLLVAGLMKTAGTDTEAWVAWLLMLQTAMHGLAVALLPALGERLLGARVAGDVAALILIVAPVAPVYPQNEALLHLVTLEACLLVPVRKATAALAGITGAFALHVNPSSLFVLGGWLWWSKPAPGWAAVYGTALALGCLPWLGRNATVLKGPVFVRDNLGVELRTSNNDLATPLFARNEVAMRRWHPNVSLAEAREVARVGEVAYMRAAMAGALEWMAQNPEKTAVLTLQRFRYYWLPVFDNRRWYDWLLTILTLAAVPGMIRVWRHPVFFSALALSPLLFYLIQCDPRYRQPFIWATVLLLQPSLATVAGLSGKRHTRAAVVDARGTREAP